ncbi:MULTISPECIES: nuclear transport factor 2 family protein [Vibrio]|uniref:nuclear transport factor 2 family protein n=1 Tax=Vibrio TaxID=662 RepID=UPI0020752BE6|nr:MULTISPECIES: ester cyclase [Vibrio]USD31418.1 ester cyclase [Vibrio sp. SCSIO 43186]USD44462.1 ester cyclase [Vibrio sp. SCSIO 43145]USD68541.1 ester cyclase [Vibrio sp. SCSIO 43139]USD96231.1 polyketide cyclase [Vibrio coralliilyticus]
MSLNIIEHFYQRYFKASPNEQAIVAQQALNPDVKWCVAHPVNDLNGPDAAHTSFLSPLVTAMPDVERRPMIVMNGEFEGRTWYNSTGYFVGTFEQPLFGIPATGKTLYLRYTEMVCIENNQITESYMIPDFIDVMNQSNANPLRKSLGHDGLIPSPATADGIQSSEVCDEASDKSGQLVNDMLACLGRFDGKDLYSMDLENYWHKDFMWYGPAGIGTTRGIKGFRNHHQAPFVFAFPDRSVDIELNFLAKNDYVSTGGWPHMHGTHTGHSGWLGLAPTGKNIELRVMDIWRREGNLLKENWVGIDIIHILLQLGYDVFGQMKEQLEGPNYA